MADNEQQHASARQPRMTSIGGWLVRATVVGALLVCALPAFAGTVVTDQVFNLSTSAQSNVPVTFGQVFKDGDVPAGASLTATLGGQPIPLQVDIKATNSARPGSNLSDGSLRHAVLTVIVPQLPVTPGPNGIPLVLSTGGSTPQGAIGLSQLLATSYDTQASFNFGGVTYTVNARPLLQAAANAGACAPWNTQCNVWLSGPLVSEWVVNAPATSSSGATAPGLQVYFAVRAYSNGAGGVGQVRTDIIVENTNAFAPQVQPQYTATLTSGSASYTSPALTQYTATRWHQVLWWNATDPQVYLQQNTQYIQDSKAVSRYMALQPDVSVLESVRQTCAPLDNCDQTQKMHMTGAQQAIGPLPRWTSVYIVDPDVRAYNWMLANTDALGAYGIHFRDVTTGYPVSIQNYPYITITAWSSYRGKPGQLPGCVNNAVVTGCTTAWYGDGNPDEWDNAHQPAEAYVPYMVTGSYYYMSEVAFAASNNEIWGNPGYRGYAKGLIDATHGQTRGKAWTLREMVDAAWILPDSYPLKAEFNADVSNSIADFNANYTNNPNAGPLGIPNSAVTLGDGAHSMAPWQQYFLTWSANHAAELGFVGAADFRDWLATFDIALMGGPPGNPSGFCWLYASDYLVQVKDAAGNWLPNFAAVYAANYPTLAGLACNSSTMIAAMGTLQSQPWQAGQMSGYANSATGFPSNLQIGLAAIADSGVPGAADAWALFDSRSVQPNGQSSSDPSIAYRNYPNFAVIPRTAVVGTVQPPTMPAPGTIPPATPPPTTPPPATTPPATPPPATPPPATPPPTTPPPTTPPPTTPPPTTPPPTTPPPTTPPPTTPPGLTSSFWNIVFDPIQALMPRCIINCGAPAVVSVRAAPATKAAPTTRPAAAATPAPVPVALATARPSVAATPISTTPTLSRMLPSTGFVDVLLRAACGYIETWCARELPAYSSTTSRTTVVAPVVARQAVPATVRQAAVLPRASAAPAVVQASVRGQIAPAMASQREVSGTGLVNRPELQAADLQRPCKVESAPRATLTTCVVR